MRICQRIKFIQRICVEFPAHKFNANFARKVADDLQMRAHAFANACIRKRKFNASRTKFHLSPNICTQMYVYVCMSVCVCVRNEKSSRTYVARWKINEKNTTIAIRTRSCKFDN